jgi:thiol-disulfide isomerase/thioredoxin
MKQKTRHIIITLLLIISGAVPKLSGQKIEYLKIPDLEKILNNTEDKLYVINFWATWCAPCVSELPAFEKVAKDFNQSKVRFLLVSLDFPSQIEKQLIPFLKKNKISLDVAVMMETDANLWIDKVDPSWQGNIPSTLVLNNQKKIRHFHSEALDEQGLRKLINAYL